MVTRLSTEEFAEFTREEQVQSLLDRYRQGLEERETPQDMKNVLIQDHRKIVDWAAARPDSSKEALEFLNERLNELFGDNPIAVMLTRNEIARICESLRAYLTAPPSPRYALADRDEAVVQEFRDLIAMLEEKSR